MSEPRPSAVLSTRALNRALLARQGLLDRWAGPAEAAIARLVGLQAQAPNPPYVGLWTRLDGFRPDELSRLLTERRAVRATLMRGTIHLVTAGDALALWPVVRAVAERVFTGSPSRRDAVTGLDLDALLAAGRALVEERPRTLADLGTLLGERHPGRDARSLAQAVQFLSPVVQVPPRGLWGQSGPAAWTTTPSWLGHPTGPDDAPDATILRYLAAFGPATVADAQAWSGLTGLRAAFDRLRSRLVTVRNDHGRELFDLPDAPRPDPATPVPPRYLPEFDNLILSHADRTRVIPAEHKHHLASKNGLVPATILVDGFVSGTWSIARERGAATLVVRPFSPLGQGDVRALVEEGERLMAFVAGDAGSRGVRFAEPK